MLLILGEKCRCNASFSSTSNIRSWDLGTNRTKTCTRKILTKSKQNIEGSLWHQIFTIIYLQVYVFSLHHLTCHAYKLVYQYSITWWITKHCFSASLSHFPFSSLYCLDFTYFIQTINSYLSLCFLRNSGYLTFGISCLFLIWYTFQ